MFVEQRKALRYRWVRESKMQPDLGVFLPVLPGPKAVLSQDSSICMCLGRNETVCEPDIWKYACSVLEKGLSSDVTINTTMC
jgi:hypothetical protein